MVTRRRRRSTTDAPALEPPADDARPAETAAPATLADAPATLADAPATVAGVAAPVAGVPTTADVAAAADVPDPTDAAGDLTPAVDESGAAAVVAATAGSASAFPGILHRRVVVDVPGSTANLGAGYDTLAMALDLVNRITVEVLPEPEVELIVEGEGAGQLEAGRRNRFVLALELGLRWALGEVPNGIGWRILMRNEIPLTRGLGSSAAAVVAGLVAADALTGGRLDERRQLQLACELEGHPDNAAAALLGGFVVVAMIDGRPEAVRFDVPSRLRAVLFVPDRPLETAAMRAALPRDVPHRDASFNVSRGALAVAAIASGRYTLLRQATEDRLHEPYRAAVYPELPLLVSAARRAGALGACLSGAGSAVIAFADDEPTLDATGRAMAEAAGEQGLTGRVRPVAIRNAGPIVVDLD